MAATGPRASQLFHTIVVVGAAMGCGTSRGTVGPSPAPSVDAGAAGLTPGDCPSTAQYQCDPSGHCSCDLQSPLGVCDCARPGEFRCRGCVSGAPILGRCPLDDGISCFCNTSIAIASPTDCAHPEQFTCAPPPPFTEDAGGVLFGTSWFDYGECSCETTLPLTVADCSSSCTPCSFRCSSVDCPAGSAAAALASVRFNCQCIPGPVPIAQAP